MIPEESTIREEGSRKIFENYFSLKVTKLRHSVAGVSYGKTMS
jgi:hypothetical protein